MMRYEESGDFTTTLHRRLLYILNENLPGSTWYCIAMKMLQYYGDLDMISIEEMASLCAVSKSTISKFNIKSEFLAMRTIGHSKNRLRSILIENSAKTIS